MEYRLSFQIDGNEFKPSTIEFPFSSSYDVGNIQTRGKNKGFPSPHGQAMIEICCSRDQGHEELAKICTLFKQLKPALIAAGADYFALWILRDYKDQCNEELSPEELQQIASLGCTLCYSAYDVDSEI